jgi:hypothetical protein
VSEESAKLVLDENGLQVIGKGRIDSDMTIELIEALLKLPSTGENSTKSIIHRFSVRTRDAFERIVKLDTKLSESFGKILIGHTILAKDVGDEIILGIQPIAVIIFANDGRVFVSRETRKYDNLETIEEFENRTGFSVLDWLKMAMADKAEKAHRLIALLESKPVEYLVDVVKKDEKGNLAAHTLNITVSSEEQIYLHAKRHGHSVMNITPEKKE